MVIFLVTLFFEYICIQLNSIKHKRLIISNMKQQTSLIKYKQIQHYIPCESTKTILFKGGFLFLLFQNFSFVIFNKFLFSPFLICFKNKRLPKKSSLSDFISNNIYKYSLGTSIPFFFMYSTRSLYLSSKPFPHLSEILHTSEGLISKISEILVKISRLIFTLEFSISE